MKVNFRKFPVYTSIRKAEKVNADISEGVANAIYMSVGGIAAKSLAMRIFEEGEVELNSREIAIVTNAAQGCVGIMADSLYDYFCKKGSDGKN